MKKNIIIILLSVICSQKLITDIDKNDILRIEYESIKKSYISEELFYAPFVEKKPSKNHFNIFKNLSYNSYFVLEPVIGLRYSNTGFNMYVEENLSNVPVTWITPGIIIHSTIPILKKISNIWVYSWGSFYKHSAYGYSGNNTITSVTYPLFNYNSKSY